MNHLSRLYGGVQPKNSKKSFEKPVKWGSLSRTLTKRHTNPRQGNLQLQVAVGQKWARSWESAEGRDVWKKWQEGEGVMAPGAVLCDDPALQRPRESPGVPSGKSLHTGREWPASGAGCGQATWGSSVKLLQSGSLTHTPVCHPQHVVPTW